MILRNVTAGETIFVSKALYEHDGWELTGTTNFASAPGPHIDGGDTLKVIAIYDDSRTRRDVMGNLRASIVLDEVAESPFRRT
jgi:hypothetical protein